MPLTERLELDLNDALRNLGRIDDALSRSARSFKADLAAALDPLSGIRLSDIDAREVTRAIDSAVDDANLAPEIEADADPVTSAIDDAVEAADTETVIEGDASSVTDEIDSAVAAADGEVPLSVTEDEFVAAVAAAVDEAVSNADATVTIDADTSSAQSSIEGLGSSAEEASGGLSSLEDATTRAGGAAGVATGDFSGLESLLGSTSAAAAAAVAGIGALAAVTGVFFKSALEADTASRAFNHGLGDMADAVQHIQIGGLNEKLSDLALRTGNSDEALLLAAARIGELGRSSGASQTNVGNLAQNVEVLAIRATTLNPTLGQAGDVADTMTNAFARGGRALAPFGIDLSTAQINAKALADTGKQTASDLTIFEKAVAGSTLAVQNLGTGLAKDINDGAQGAEVRLRSLKEQVGELAERLGQPLLEPVLSAFTEAQPIIENVGEGFGELAQIAVPLLVDALHAFQPSLSLTTDLLSALSPLLHLIIDVVDAIPGPILAGAAAFKTFNGLLGGLANSLSTSIAPGSALGGTLAGLTPVMAGVGAAVVVVTSVLGEMSRQKAAARQATLDLAGALADETKAYGDSLRATTEQDLRSTGLTSRLSELGISYEQLTAAISHGHGPAQEFLDTLARQHNDASLALPIFGSFGQAVLNLADRFQASSKEVLSTAVNQERLTRSAVDAAEAHHRLEDGTADYVGVLEELLPKEAELITGHKDAATAADRQTDAEQRLTDELNKQIDALLSLVDKNFASERAQLSFRESTARLTEAKAALNKAIEETGTKSDATAEAQRRLEGAQLSERESAVRAATAQADLKNEQVNTGNAAEDALRKQLNLRDSFLAVAATLAPGSPLRTELERYANQVEGVPSSKNTTLTNNAAAAKAGLDAVIFSLDTIDGKTVTSTVVIDRVFNEGDQGFLELGHAMAGAIVGPGEAFIAGDPGEHSELVVGGTAGGRIFTHSETVQILAEALARGSQSQTVAAPSAGRAAPLIGQLNVNEVAADPLATAFAVSARLGRLAER